MGPVTDMRLEIASLQKQKNEVNDILVDTQRALEGYKKRLQEIELEMQKVNNRILKELQNEG